MTDAADQIRCTHQLGGDGLRCSLEYDHHHGHVYADGSWVTDRHIGN